MIVINTFILIIIISKAGKKISNLKNSTFYLVCDTLCKTLTGNNMPNGQASGAYSSDEIAAMPLEQLRELSDLQLSERELADVIAAIHGGGAQSIDHQGDYVINNDAEAFYCPLCPQDGLLVPTGCFACIEGASTHDLQKQAHLLDQWVNWYKQYKNWQQIAQKQT